MFFSQIKQEEHSPQGTQLEPFVTGTPSSIKRQVLRKLYAKFDTFVTSVTIRPISCTKRPDYSGLSLVHFLRQPFSK